MINLKALLVHNEDTSKYLYHYTSMNNALKILTSNKIGFNTFGQSNDPLEKIEIAFNKFDTLISYFKFLSFCQDKYPLKKFSLRNRGSAKLRMWAQYGENHKGCCLIFSKKELVAELMKQENIILKGERVKYINYLNSEEYSMLINNLYTYFFFKSPSPNHETFLNDILEPAIIVQNTFRKKFSGIFFYKDNDYQDENELRLIIYPKVENKLFKNKLYLVDYNNSLKAIVSGLFQENTDYELIKDFCKNQKKSIKTCKLIKSKGDFVSYDIF